MAKMMTGAPAQKVTAAAAAAALVTVLVKVFEDKLPGLSQYQAELTTVVVFMAGYLMPPASVDAIMQGETIVTAVPKTT